MITLDTSKFGSHLHHTCMATASWTILIVNKANIEAKHC